MTTTRITDLGSVGLITDVAPNLLPPEALTVLRNMHGEDRSVVSTFGESKLFDLEIEPKYYTTFVDVNGKSWAIVSDGVDVHAYSINENGLGGGPVLVADPEKEIASGMLVLSDKFITFAVLNGILLINSSIDGLYYWPGEGNRLKKYPGPGDGESAPANGWDWTNGWRCRAIAAFKNNVFALGMEESGEFYQYKIRWTNSAEPGALPTEWAITTSNDADYRLLADTPGRIMGSAIVRNQLFVIKEDAIYAGNYIGLPYLFSFTRLMGTKGTTMKFGFTECKGALALFTGNDLVLFDGTQSVSLVEDKIRRHINNVINSAYSGSEIDISSPKGNRLYYHWPSDKLFLLIGGNNIFTDAFVFDLKEQQWGHKDATWSLGMSDSIISTNSSFVYDDMGPGGPAGAYAVPYNQQLYPYSKGVYQATSPEIIIFQTNSGNSSWWVSVKDDSSTGYDGSIKECEMGRDGIPIEGCKGLATITELWPEIEAGDLTFGSASANILFQIGVQNYPGGEISWARNKDGSIYFSMDPSGNPFIDPLITGRFLCWRAKSNVQGTWRIGAITFTWEPSGEI